ncbi:hypothetical protein BJ742DRAFT_882917 [Cladochytrium replicatum]|nr:hypothetical protein BJ742DRAFT_882917 [Cladochytrium replicatum]
MAFQQASGSSDGTHSELSLDNLIRDTISLSPEDLSSSLESGTSSPELRSTLDPRVSSPEHFPLALPLAAIAPSPIGDPTSPHLNPGPIVDHETKQLDDTSLQQYESSSVDLDMYDSETTEEDSEEDGDYIDGSEEYGDDVDHNSEEENVATEPKSSPKHSEPAFLQRRAKMAAMQRISVSNDGTDNSAASSSSRRVKQPSPTPSTTSSSSSCSLDENERTRKRKKASPAKPKSTKRARGKRPNFTKEQREWLTDWCRRFAKDPYPSEEEKEYIEMKLSLTRSQLDYWLTNARRGRVLRKIPGRHPEHKFIKK